VKLIHIAKRRPDGLIDPQWVEGFEAFSIQSSPKVYILLIQMNLVAGSKVGTKQSKLIRRADSDPFPTLL